MFGCDPRLRLRTMNVGVVGLLDYLHWQWGLLTYCCSSLHIRGQQALSVAITRERETLHWWYCKKTQQSCQRKHEMHASSHLFYHHRIELLAEISRVFYKNEIINFPVDLISRNYLLSLTQGLSSHISLCSTVQQVVKDVVCISVGPSAKRVYKVREYCCWYKVNLDTQDRNGYGAVVKRCVTR